MGSLGLVGFDAANVVRSTLHQFSHQLIGLSLDRRQREREREREREGGEGEGEKERDRVI